MRNRKALTMILVLPIILAVGCKRDATQRAVPATSATPAESREVAIERLDPRFDSLVPISAKVEKLADGFQWTEGPVWNRKSNFLLFTNIPGNEIVRWEEGRGISLFLKPSGYTGEAPFTGKEPGANGLTWDSEGRLVLCQHGDRRIARLEADGRTVTPLIDKFEGKRFNSPNDLVFKSNGDLYFTDPIYGLPKGADDPARELDFCGVYRLSKSGKLSLLTREITRPNGIGFSPDEKRLYVASSDPEQAIWMVYDVAKDGTITNGKVFYDATSRVKEGKKGLPDGLKIDRSGNIFATGPGGVMVFAPDGTLLGLFNTGVATANCAWGNDGSTLYITANTALLRVRLSTRGY